MAFINVPRSFSSKVRRHGRPCTHFYFTLYSSTPSKNESHIMCVFSPKRSNNGSFQWNRWYHKRQLPFRKERRRKELRNRRADLRTTWGTPRCPAPRPSTESSRSTRGRRFPLSVFRFNWALSKCCCEREILFISARAAKNEPDKL